MKESKSATTATLSTPKKLNGPILRGQRCQSFALPKNIVYYMAMNPASAKSYKKLVRTCKFFYNINPILVVSELRFGETDADSGEYVWEVKINEGELFCKINMDKIPFKIWITKFVWIEPWNQKYENVTASFVQKKLFRSDAPSVFFEGQVLTLKEFSLLFSKAKEIEFLGITITENDGEDKEVMFEKIIEKLPNVRDINWECGHSHDCFSSDTVKELIKIPHFGDIAFFRMYSTPNEFDAKTLFEYIKTQKKHMTVLLDYGGSKLSAKLKKQIDEMIDEMYTTDIFTYKPLSIHYAGIGDDQLKKINEYYDRYENAKTQL